MQVRAVHPQILRGEETAGMADDLALGAVAGLAGLGRDGGWLRFHFSFALLGGLWFYPRLRRGSVCAADKRKMK